MKEPMMTEADVRLLIDHIESTRDDMCRRFSDASPVITLLDHLVDDLWAEIDVMTEDDGGEPLEDTPHGMQSPEESAEEQR